MNMDLSNQTLTVFVIVNFLNMATLFADNVIIRSNLPSITYVSVKYPILGTVLVLLETLCPISLGLHFWYSRNNTD